MAARSGPATVRLEEVGAVIFDTDGVVTDTASVHAAAWKRLFDAYLEERSQRTGEPFREFDIDRDYRRYVDGKPRYDGIRDFLGSRAIILMPKVVITAVVKDVEAWLKFKPELVAQLSAVASDGTS